MSNFLPSSASIKQVLLKIYTCKEPFELYVVDRKFKRRLGTYFVEKQKINIYAKGMDGHIIMRLPFMNMHTTFTTRNNIHGTYEGKIGRMAKSFGAFTLHSWQKPFAKIFSKMI